MSKINLFSAILFLSAVSIAAAKTDSLVQRQQRYVMKLYGSGRYFQCIAEARKGMLYHKADKEESRYVIYSSYFMGGQYLTVSSRLGAVKGIMKNSGKPDNRNFLLLSQTSLRLGAYQDSSAYAFALSYEGDAAMEKYEVLMRRIEPLLYMERYDAALSEIETYKKIKDPDTAVVALEKELHGHGNIPRRSKALAMVLSAFVPGLGQAYCGSYLDGLLGFLGTGITAAGGAWLYKQDEKGLAGAAFFFSALFYTGNLYGAYNSAADFNRRYREMYRDDLRARYMHPYDPARYFRWEQGRQ